MGEFKPQPPVVKEEEEAKEKKEEGMWEYGQLNHVFFNKAGQKEQHDAVVGLKKKAYNFLNATERLSVSLDESRVDNIYRSMAKGEYFSLDQEQKNRMNIYIDEISSGLTKLMLLAKEGKATMPEDELEKLLEDFSSKVKSNPEAMIQK